MMRNYDYLDPEQAKEELIALERRLADAQEESSAAMQNVRTAYEAKIERLEAELERMKVDQEWRHLDGDSFLGSRFADGACTGFLIALAAAFVVWLWKNW